MTNNGVNVAALGFGGIDTSSLLSSLVAIQQQPYNQLASQQQNIQSAQTTISSFSSTLSALKTAAAALSDPGTFTSMAATSSDSSIAAKTNPGAASGQWTVSVTSIAQEQRTLSNPVSSPTSALGITGSLDIQVGTGTTAHLAVSPSDTLTDIASKISASGLRVQASMTFDGSQYRLLVTGLDTGAANTITFGESVVTSSQGYTFGLSTPANTIQKSQDAALTVGNMPVTSASNQVTDAIPGVTLALTQPTKTPATIAIASDPTAIQTKVQAFVTAYNAVVSNGHSVAGFGTQKASNTLLQGDHAVRSALDQLGSLMGQAVPGTSGAYTTLDNVGVALNADGTLTLNSAKLGTALSKDPTSVERLFVTDASNGSQGIMGTFGSTVDTLTKGTGSMIQSELDGFSARMKQMSTQMAAMQVRTAAYQTLLQKQFTQMNTTLAQYKQIASSLNSASGNNSSNNNGVL
jgi:flagellar hook-associated protein 2